ncbi:hypothetical protein SDC9_120246 [bioreactor metagenome]|uniref:Uncharacterized protein n=1 Tax=bioreactor metagenome TaxID=1076179 RepID=A0A645C692_9ZZZZ
MMQLFVIHVKRENKCEKSTREITKKIVKKRHKQNIAYLCVDENLTY